MKHIVMRREQVSRTDDVYFRNAVENCSVNIFLNIVRKMIGVAAAAAAAELTPSI